MPNLVFLSETPTGQLAELKATMSWPKSGDLSQRNLFLSNTLKSHYTKSIEDILNSNHSKQTDDALRGLYSSIYAFESNLYNSLGGINKIMSSDNISEFVSGQTNKINRLAGLVLYLLYCHDHDYRFDDIWCSSRTRINKYLSGNPFPGNFAITNKPAALRGYYLARAESIHIVAAHFVFREITKLLNNLQFDDLLTKEQNSIQSFYFENRLELTMGYAKTFYDWGIAKKVMRDEGPPIDSKRAWRLPGGTKAIPLPEALADYYSSYVPMIYRNKTRPRNK